MTKALFAAAALALLATSAAAAQNRDLASFAGTWCKIDNPDHDESSSWTHFKRGKCNVGDHKATLVLRPNGDYTLGDSEYSIRC
jgi:hypothetical protein